MPGPLMIISDQNSTELPSYPATGMGFYIITRHYKYLAVLEEGAALPLDDDPDYFNVEDLLKGDPLPTQRDQAPYFDTQNLFSSRLDALQALQASGTGISPLYTGTAGAVPLIRTLTLQKDTIFFRYLSKNIDPRFENGELTAKTYLTSYVDKEYAKSGLGAVGRYALPLPLPASYLIQYEIPKGTTIKVGTVAPMFGQSGGGVEVWLPDRTPAVCLGHSLLPDF